MEISPILLAKMLFYALVLGAFTGVFYDVQGVISAFFGVCTQEKMIAWKLPLIKKGLTLKKANKQIFKNVILFFGDFLTVLFAGAGVIILNYSFNKGQFRFFTVIGTFVGFVCYFFTVGNITKRILPTLAFFVKYCVFSFFVLLGYPLYSFLKIIFKFVIKIFFLFKIILENRRKKVYNIYEKVCFLDLAKNGFLDKTVLEKIKNK